MKDVITLARIAPIAEIEATRGALEALAHPTRQRILALLFQEHGGLAYNDIAERLGFKEASSIDQHLKKLVGTVLVGNVLKRVDGRIRSFFFITDWGEEWMDRCHFTSPETVRTLVAGTKA